MYIPTKPLIGVFTCLAFIQGCSDSSDSPQKELIDPAIAFAESAAIEVNKRQQEAWNNLDAEGEAAVNHYPFIRISGGSLIVFEAYETYRNIVEAISLPNLVTTEWDHTAWDELEVFQSSPTKVHLSGRFSRINKDGEKYLSTETVRIVIKDQDQWGIKVRSTYPLTTHDEINDTGSDEIAVAESAAMEVLKKYILAWNNRDSTTLSELHHYPSILLQGINLHRFNTPEDYVSYQENEVFHGLDYAEWDHSYMNEVEVIKSGIDTVHLAVECEDINVIGESCGSGEKGVWIITEVGNKWRIHARSLF